MAQWRRYLRLWLVLALVVVALLSAAALWLRGARPGEVRSPLPTPATSHVSPLATPSFVNTTSPPPSSWTNGGVVLLWVALGILLALVIAFVILRCYYRSV